MRPESMTDGVPGSDSPAAAAAASVTTSLHDLQVLVERGTLSGPEKQQADHLVTSLKRELVLRRVGDHLAERTFHELCVRLAVMERDWAAMERHIQQLMPLYELDRQAGIQSPHRDLLVGLNLMRLLAQNRLAEYHMELELLPTTEPQQNPYVLFPFQVEQALTEGSYQKILHIEAGAEWLPFIELLRETTIQEMVTSWAEAYAHVTLEELASMAALPVEQVPALLARVLDCTQYVVQNETVHFIASDHIREAPSQYLLAKEAVSRTMEYIRGLERIV